MTSGVDCQSTNDQQSASRQAFWGVVLQNYQKFDEH